MRAQLVKNGRGQRSVLLHAPIMRCAGQLAISLTLEREDARIDLLQAVRREVHALREKPGRPMTAAVGALTAAKEWPDGSHRAACQASAGRAVEPHANPKLAANQHQQQAPHSWPARHPASAQTPRPPSPAFTVSVGAISTDSSVRRWLFVKSSSVEVLVTGSEAGGCESSAMAGCDCPQERTCRTRRDN